MLSKTTIDQSMYIKALNDKNIIKINQAQCNKASQLIFKFNSASQTVHTVRSKFINIAENKKVGQGNKDNLDITPISKR
jgi:hypothetical protein